MTETRRRAEEGGETILQCCAAHIACRREWAVSSFPHRLAAPQLPGTLHRRSHRRLGLARLFVVEIRDRAAERDGLRLQARVELGADAAKDGLGEVRRHHYRSLAA